MRSNGLAAEANNLITAIFAEHGDMYIAGWETQLVLQPGIDAFFVDAPVALQIVQRLVGLYPFAAGGLVGKFPHRAMAIAGMCLDIGIAGGPPSAHIEPGVFRFGAVTIHDAGRA